MRDFSNFDRYIDQLVSDIYPQPVDPGHTAWASAAIDWMANLAPFQGRGGAANVLDVGCGEGFCAPLFEARGIHWTGVTVGHDYQVGMEAGRNVKNFDMTFLNECPDSAYDLVFARHVLEHSPFPIITLMEWLRVASKYLLLVAPSPDYWGWTGLNHYSVMNRQQLEATLQRAGWVVVAQHELKMNDPLYKEFNPKAEIENPRHPKEVEFWMFCYKP